MNKRSVQDVRFSAPQPTLDVNEFVQRYVRKPLTKQVPVQQPTELGSMSRDSKRNWHIGSRAEFAKLKLPQSLPLDLNPGFTQFRQAYQESDPDRYVPSIVDRQQRIASRDGNPTLIKYERYGQSGLGS